MAFLGNIERFDLAEGDWQIYVERLSQFFAVNDIAEERQVPALLSLVGEKTYKLIRSLTAPTAPHNRTFEQLVALVQAHLNPTPLVTVERFRFNKTCQEQGMSIQNFVAELKRRSEHCDFGANLNEAICDRFVCGLRSTAIQKRLLTEPDLTLQRAMDIALSMDTAARDAEEFHPSVAGNESMNVNKLKLLGVGQHDKGKFRRTEEQHESSKNTIPPHVVCHRCGNKGHYATTCRFRFEQCRFCHKQGHIMRVCKKRSSSSTGNFMQQPEQSRYTQKAISKPVRNLDSVDRVDVESEFTLFHLNSRKVDPFLLTVKIEDKMIDMELDTGSAVSVISEEYYKLYFSHLPMQASDLHLITYTGEHLSPKGWIKVHVEYKDQHTIQKLYVVAHPTAVPLMGRDWLQDVKLDWVVLKMLKERPFRDLQQILEKHKGLFSDKLGCLKGFKATLHLKDASKPVFMKARPVPYSLRKAVEDELDRLEELGVITPVKFSNWATPIVPVIKKDGTVRICGDYRMTINPSLDVDKYPLPVLQDMFSTLAGGQVFSKLDLERAYQQLEVDDASAEILTLNTHKGLYRMNRLSFGVASAPAIFQRAIDQVLQGINGNIAYLDDILVKGINSSDHLTNLDETLSVIEDSGLTLKLRKCEFEVSELEFMGHIISKVGVKASPKKVEAVVDAPRPTNVTELRSFLGMINYYAKFLPNLSTILHPLHQLLCKDSPWTWEKRQEDAFLTVKKMLISTQVLTHYDPDKTLLLACDASAYGVGAVLSHLESDGREYPVAFASRTLTKAERGYAQVEREALALIFGIKRFHQFLYGRKFILETDHQPLVKLLGPKHGFPVLAAARLQRWSLLLSAYQYEIRYRKGKDLSNADGLSRLPLPYTAVDEDVEIFNLNQLQRLPVTSTDIARETKKDPILSKVLLQTSLGWKVNQETSLKSYYTRRHEITIEQGCLLWGVRVIVPETLQQEVLRELHICHSGIVRMKTMARGYFWWPGLDSDIEKLAGSCEECQKHRNAPIPAPLHPWAYPEKPWQRLHIDFAGPMFGIYFCIVVDSYSKWPEIAVMTLANAEKTIEFLRTIFARFGLPEQIVSDNGTQFTAEVFQLFLKANGIKHFRSAPYHPATNGLAERFVQTLKSALKKEGTDQYNLQQRLQQFLLMYRNTVHPTTRRSPSQLLLGRDLRTRMTLLRPSVERDVAISQTKSILNRAGRERDFEVGSSVIVKDYRTPGKKTWEKAVITSQTGPVSYEVETESGQTWHRHQDQIVSTPHILPGVENLVENENQAFVPNQATDSSKLPESQKGLQDTEVIGTPRGVQNYSRYPTRVRRAPKRLDL